MQLELSHSKRLGQTVSIAWDRFLSRYFDNLNVIESDRVYKELCETGKSKLADESGTLYIEVVRW